MKQTTDVAASFVASSHPCRYIFDRQKSLLIDSGLCNRLSTSLLTDARIEIWLDVNRDPRFHCAFGRQLNERSIDLSF